MKERIKSYSFWTALSGAVVLLVNALGECFGFAIDNDLISSLIMSIAGILVVFGVVTMPTKKVENSAEENTQNLEEGQDNNLEETQAQNAQNEENK